MYPEISPRHQELIDELREYGEKRFSKENISQWRHEAGLPDEVVKDFVDLDFKGFNVLNRGADGNYDLFAHARERVEGIAMRTTVIAGFPGETDEDFSELLDFLEQADLDYVGVFPYSREDGTRAARMEGQIDEETKLARAQEVRDLCVNDT